MYTATVLTSHVSHQAWGKTFQPHNDCQAKFLCTCVSHYFFQSVLQAAQFLQGKCFLETWSHWWLLHHWDHSACQEQLKKGKSTLAHGVTSSWQGRHSGYGAWSYLHLAYSHHRGSRNKEKGECLCPGTYPKSECHLNSWWVFYQSDSLEYP